MKFANFALPELMHNLNLLVDMCEQVNELLLITTFEKGLKEVKTYMIYCRTSFKMIESTSLQVTE